MADVHEVAAQLVRDVLLVIADRIANYEKLIQYYATLPMTSTRQQLAINDYNAKLSALRARVVKLNRPGQWWQAPPSTGNATASATQ